MASAARYCAESSSGAPGAQAGGIRSISAILVNTVVSGNPGGDVYWAASQDAHGACKFFTLYNFGGPGCPQNQLPLAPPTVGPDGTLYGTTLGASFALSTNGTASSYRALASGNARRTGLALSGTTLYGTDAGEVFKLNTDGTGVTKLLALTNASDLVLSGTTLYGTTFRRRQQRGRHVVSPSDGRHRLPGAPLVWRLTR